MSSFKSLNTSLECFQFLNLTLRQLPKEVTKDINFTLLLSLAQLQNNVHENSIQLSLNDSTNTSVVNDVDDYPVFDQRALVIVIVYCCLFVIAAIGNVSSFLKLFRSRRRKSRIFLLMIHLTIADLIVTFIMIPFEIVWRLTVQWLGGNITCKIMLFMRGFGLYLSSNVMICISLDRYFAIMHPLMVSNKRSRGKRMLFGAWIAATCYALPQLVVFQVKEHPKFSNFTQCVSFGYFSTPQREFAYNMASLIAMYFLPLVIIIASYTSILWKMWRKANESQRDIPMTSTVTCTSFSENRSNTKVTSTFQETTGAECRTRLQRHHERVILRRSDMKSIVRARVRTLKMTILIVVIFLVCWTPYVVMALWYMIDRGSAQRVPVWLQDGLFMMAVSNSCMNPIVYGRYAVRSVVAGTSNSRTKHPRWYNCCNMGITKSTPNDTAVLRPQYGMYHR